MRLAVISDVHSNYTALQEVLQSLNSVSYDQLICLGDVVGYGPQPQECLEAVRDACDLVLQGNHDRTCANQNFERYSQNNMAYEGLKYSYSELTSSQISWLANLPEKSNVTESVLAVHSHPKITDEYVFPRDFPRMRPYMDDLDCMLLGHTHVQHKMEIDDRLVLNPGSVGQPRDKDPRAAYAIVDTDDLSAQFHRVNYDIDAVVERVNEQGLPESTGTRLYG